MSKRQLIWTYDSSRLVARTTSFDSFHRKLGRRATDIVGTAQLLSVDKNPATIESYVNGALRLCTAIIEYSPNATSADVWAVAAIKALQAGKLSENTRYHHYNATRAILDVIAEEHGVLIPANPFLKGGRGIRSAPDKALRRILELAEAEAMRFYNNFKDPTTHEFPQLIHIARYFAKHNGGLLPLAHDHNKTAKGTFHTFLQRVRRETLHLTRPWGGRDLARHLYATMESLTPFLILLIYKLSANVDAISGLERDCMKRVVKRLVGERYIVIANKPRARNYIEYPCVDTGPLSVPWLIRAVQEMTRPLRPFAEPRYRKYLFLSDTPSRNVWPFDRTEPHVAFASFRRRNGLPKGVAQNMFRPTRLRREWRTSHNIFRVQAMGRHRSTKSAAGYIEDAESQSVKDEIIANSQSALLETMGRGVRRQPKPRAVGPRVRLPSHDCQDPEDSASLDETGLCSKVLWPLNDRHFHVSLEPRNVAILLRDYQALLEARDRMNTERFARFYLPRLLLIQQRCLPLIDDELLARAKALIPTLAPALYID